VTIQSRSKREEKIMPAQRKRQDKNDEEHTVRHAAPLSCQGQRKPEFMRSRHTLLFGIIIYLNELTGTRWLISERRGFEPLVRLLVRFISNEVLSATQSSLHSYYSKMLRHGQDFRFIRSLQWYHTPCRTRTYDIRFWRPAFYQLN
jgi:hypothetical protein